MRVTKGQRNKLCSKTLTRCKNHLKKEKGNLKIGLEPKRKGKRKMVGDARY
jgi:hypothetical protein